MRVNFMSLLVPALLVSMIGSSVRAQSDDAKPAKESQNKETLTIKPGPFQVKVALDGVFEAGDLHEVILRPDVWSTLKIDKVIEPGTRVKKGDPVLWLETRKIDQEIKDLELQRELGYLSIKQAEAELAALEKSFPLDMEEAERSAQIAQEELDYFLKVREDLQRRSAEESLKSSQYSLEYAQEELDQLEQMYKADDLTEETEEIILKRAKRSVEQGQFYLESGKIRHARTLEVELPREKHQVEVAAARSAMSLAKSQVTLPMTLQKEKLGLEKLLRTQEQLDEKLKEMRADREQLTVTAPAAGIVYFGQNDRGKWTTASTMVKQLRPGGSVTPNTVLMTIVPEHAHTTIRTDLPEAKVRYVKRETEGAVTPTAYPADKLECIVTRVSLIPVSDGVYEAFLEFKPSDAVPLLLTGMTGKIELVPYQKDDAIAVPSSAIFTDEADDSQYVYVEDAGESRKQPVTAGEVSGDKTEIREGLSQGDVILLKKPE